MPIRGTMNAVMLDYELNHTGNHDWSETPVFQC